MRVMKDSGIEWIGEVPEGWTICKFKNVADLYTGDSIKDDEKVYYEDASNTYSYISTKDIDGIRGSVNYQNGLYIKEHSEGFKIASAQSTLMCIEGGSAGRKKALLLHDVCFINKLCCFCPTNVDGKYLESVFTRLCYTVGHEKVQEARANVSE